MFLYYPLQKSGSRALKEPSFNPKNHQENGTKLTDPRKTGTGAGAASGSLFFLPEYVAYDGHLESWLEADFPEYYAKLSIKPDLKTTTSL